MDRLEELAACAYLLTNFADEPIRLANSPDRVLQAGAGDNPRLRVWFDPRACSELLGVSAPLWLFVALENGVDRLRAELRAWMNSGHAAPARPPLPPVDFTVQLRDLRFKNGRVDQWATAARLSRDQRLPLDLRLVIAVHNGCLQEAEEICKSNPESKFQHENVIAIYRRVAMRYLEPWELAMGQKLKPMPASYLKLVPVDRLLATNFLDTAQTMIAEYVRDTSDDDESSFLNHVTEFVDKSGRNMAEIGPRIFSALIPTFCDSPYRCEKLLQLSRRLCGETVTDHWLENWPCPPNQPFSRLHAIFLATATHPLIVHKLIHLLISSQLIIDHDSLLIIAQRNDYAMSRLIQELIDQKIWFEKLWAMLCENGYELFHSICYCGARRTISTLVQNLSNEKLMELLESRQYGCLLAACKKGRFLAICMLTDRMDQKIWEQFFTFNNYDAFYQASKGGHKAIVEWFGRLCSKWDMAKTFEEARYFVVKLLEVEAKSLISALEAINAEHPPENESQ